MNSTLSNNGQRKSLATQIDRLDTMLDGLAENLNDAVAMAVKDAVALAVQEAVRAVLTEAMTNPMVLARLRPATPAAQPTNGNEKPTMGRRLASVCRWLGDRCRATWQLLRAVSSSGPLLAAQIGAAVLMPTRNKIVQICEGCRPLWRFKFQLAAALVVAGTLGVAGFFAGPVLAAASSATCGFVVTLAIQAGVWLRRRLLHALNAPTSVTTLEA